MSDTSHNAIDDKDIHFIMEYACKLGTSSESASSVWEFQWLSALSTLTQVAKSGLVE